jgi:nucleotide-binding universal stress UspA family protein
MRFNVILFPVDFSERCIGAARYVEAFASRFGSKLVLLHVVETAPMHAGDLDFGGLATAARLGDETAHSERRLQAFMANQLGFIEVERRVVTGDAAHTIVRMAHDEDMDLVMLPTHGYGPFRRFVLGSVTAKVLHDVRCPVWTGAHLEEAPAIDTITIRNVVCALDLNSGGEAALSMAASLAEEYGAKLTLVHAVPGSEAIPEKLMDSELRHNLMLQAREQLLTMTQTAGVSAEMHVEVGGEVGKAVAGAARRLGGDIVVIGRGRHDGLGRLRTHSYAIIRESPCPVLSV